MNYFSRLTDIVTCNLTEILALEEDPVSAITAIIAEMEEGLTGAARSVSTANAAVERIRKELNEHRHEADRWLQQARDAVAADQEQIARMALLRKQEAEDVTAGLEQQRQAAEATSEHLHTTQRALEARLSEARRKRQSLQSDEQADSETNAAVSAVSQIGQVSMAEDARSQRIEAELDALKRERK
ncbi:MAG: PspA/IM30 family protein [Planctomycetes bacterium]|nr:PspA/IM30 family protein [Planctomycetota bacterium]